MLSGGDIRVQRLAVAYICFLLISFSTLSDHLTCKYISIPYTNALNYQFGQSSICRLRVLYIVAGLNITVEAQKAECFPFGNVPPASSAEKSTVKNEWIFMGGFEASCLFQMHHCFFFFFQQISDLTHVVCCVWLWPYCCNFVCLLQLS